MVLEESALETLCRARSFLVEWRREHDVDKGENGDPFFMSRAHAGIYTTRLRQVR